VKVAGPLVVADEVGPTGTLVADPLVNVDIVMVLLLIGPPPPVGPEVPELIGDV